MRDILYTGGHNALWVFLFVTIVLGGAGAASIGRAIARRWRTPAQIPLAMFPLAFVVCFLHYSLFSEPTLPLATLIAALGHLGADPLGALGRIAEALHYLFVTFAILTGFAALGFWLTRRGQMARQYHWLVNPPESAGSAADSG